MRTARAGFIRRMTQGYHGLPCPAIGDTLGGAIGSARCPGGFAMLEQILDRVLAVWARISERVKAGTANGLTVRQAATLWGVSKSTAARWMAGGVPPAHTQVFVDASLPEE